MIRWALSMVALASAAVVIVAAVTLRGPAVEVQVDGATIPHRAAPGATIGEVLDELGIELATHDRLTPPAAALPADGQRIEVARAKTVDIEIASALASGVARRVTAPADVVADVLRAAQLQDLLTGDARIQPAPDAAVADGDRITVTLPVAVSATVDGGERTGTTYGRTVRRALGDLGVDLGDDDLVEPGADTVLTGPTHIRVRRVTHEDLVVEVEVVPGRVELTTHELREGTTRVDRRGRPGIEHHTYRVTRIDGEEEHRVPQRVELDRSPRDEVVLIGTYRPPSGPDRRVVHLTFDDGPDPRWTPRILDLLAEHDARAVFFVVGTQVARHPDLARRIVDEGHVIGNHTWDHPSLDGASRDEVRRQLARTQDVIAATTGVTPRCLRPPYGATDENTRLWAARADLEVVLWGTDTRDWTRPGTDAIVRSTLRGLRPGANVLLHDAGDDREQTVEAVERLLEEFDERGYRVTPAPGC